MLHQSNAIKPLDMTKIRPFYPASDESKLPNVDLRLPEGRTLTTRQHKRSMVLLSKARKAAQQLERLPDQGETIHAVLNGEYALWDFVPAVLELSGQPIDNLTICTLGFSRNNVEALSELVEAGQVKRLSVLCSTYFAAAGVDGAIYSQMVELCAKHGFPIAALRTHAKILLMATGERRIVIESSANLRSCHNVEQATILDCPELFDFHSAWMRELLEKGGK
jgi:hypothetical protein